MDPLPSPGLPAPPEHWALFLDVDGTLVEIADRPQEVRIPPSLRGLLVELRTALDDALALVSGRALADLDTLFAPLVLPAVGTHGLELRDADLTIHRPTLPREWPVLRKRFEDFARGRDGVLLEDKGASLALHYRLAPWQQRPVEQEIRAARALLGAPATVQLGKMVAEVRWGTRTKGDGIRTLMGRAPFAGRTPVFLGDDETDQAGFAAVNALEGLSIHVGATDPGVARYHLSGVVAVYDWLRDLLNARSTTLDSSPDPNA